MSEPQPTSPADAEPRRSSPFSKARLKERMESHLAEYGQLFLVVLLALSVLNTGGFFVALKLGFQPQGAAGSAGLLGAAWVLSRPLKPFVVALSFVLTPVLARLLRYKKRSRTA